MTVHESRTSAGLGHGKASGMTELHVNFTQKRHDLYDRRNVKNRLGNTRSCHSPHDMIRRLLVPFGL